MILRALIGKVFNKFIKLIPISYSEEMFYRIGLMLGVRSFTYDKELGLFEGSINDNVVYRILCEIWHLGTWIAIDIRKIICQWCGTFIDIGANIALTVFQVQKIIEK